MSAIKSKKVDSGIALTRVLPRTGITAELFFVANCELSFFLKSARMSKSAGIGPIRRIWDFANALLNSMIDFQLKYTIQHVARTKSVHKDYSVVFLL